MGTEHKAGFENSRMKGSLTIVGLGPGAAGHLSLETLKLLEERFVILRTEIHPTVAELKRRGISYISCDTWYEKEARTGRRQRCGLCSSRQPAGCGADSCAAAGKSGEMRYTSDG